MEPINKSPSKQERHPTEFEGITVIDLTGEPSQLLISESSQMTTTLAPDASISEELELNQLIQQLKNVEGVYHADPQDSTLPINSLDNRIVKWLREVLGKMMSKIEQNINTGQLTFKKKMYDEFSKQAILNIFNLVLIMRKELGPQGWNKHGLSKLKHVDSQATRILGFLKTKYPEKELEATSSDISNLQKVSDHSIKEPANNTLKYAVVGTNKLIEITKDKNWTLIPYEKCQHEQLIKQMLEQHLKAAAEAQADFLAETKRFAVTEKGDISGTVLVGLKLNNYERFFAGRTNLDFQNAEMLRIIIKLIEGYDEYIEAIIGGKANEKKYDFPSLDFSNPVNLTKADEQTLKKILEEQYNHVKDSKIELRIPQALSATSSTVPKFQKENLELPTIDSIVGLTTALMSDITYKTAINYLELLIHCLLCTQYRFNQEKSERDQKINILHFRLYDLVRGCMYGTLEQLILAFNALHPHILRFKNRLQTNNKDLFLNVMFPNSKKSDRQRHPIVGELQLRIKEDGKSSVRDKIWHDFAHFIYELERNKLGMISEIFINSNTYNYSTIKYFRDKINNKDAQSLKLSTRVDEVISKYPFVKGQLLGKSNTHLGSETTKSQGESDKFTCFNCWKYYEKYNRFCLMSNTTPATYLCEFCVYRSLPAESRKKDLFKEFERFFEEIRYEDHTKEIEKLLNEREQAFLCTIDRKLRCNLIHLVKDTDKGFKAFATLEGTEPVSLFTSNESEDPLYLYKLDTDKFDKMKGANFSKTDNVLILKINQPSEQNIRKFSELQFLTIGAEILLVDSVIDPLSTTCKLQIMDCIRSKITDSKIIEELKNKLDKDTLDGDQSYFKNCGLTDTKFLKFIGSPSSLDLSCNELESTRENPMFRNITPDCWKIALTNLNLSHNRLTYLDMSLLGQLNWLRILNVSWNNLEEIVLAKQKVPALKELYLYENRISDIRFLPHLSEFDSLLALSLSENRISGKLELRRLVPPKLQRLFLTNNFITEIATELEKNDLKELSLAGNLLTEVNFSSLKTAVKINISRNPIRYITPPSKDNGSIFDIAYTSISQTTAAANKQKFVYKEFQTPTPSDPPGSISSEKKPVAKIWHRSIENQPSRNEENYKYRLDGLVNWHLNKFIGAEKSKESALEAFLSTLPSSEIGSYFFLRKENNFRPDCKNVMLRLVRSKAPLLQESFKTFCETIIEELPKLSSNDKNLVFEVLTQSPSLL